MAKRIIIVDGGDKIIALQDRNKLAAKDIYRVSVLWLKNSKGDVLLAQRAYSKKHHPGKWGPAVAGTIEEGESYKDNIIKETKEELGLENVSLVKGSKYLITGEYNHFTQWFTAVIDREIDEFKIQKDEVNAIKWFSEEELRQNIKNNPDIFLDSFLEYVKIFYSIE